MNNLRIIKRFTQFQLWKLKKWLSGQPEILRLNWAYFKELEKLRGKE